MRKRVWSRLAKAPGAAVDWTSLPDPGEYKGSLRCWTSAPHLRACQFGPCSEQRLKVIRRGGQAGLCDPQLRFRNLESPGRYGFKPEGVVPRALSPVEPAGVPILL